VLSDARAERYHIMPVKGSAVSRDNIVYLVIGALIIVAAVLGYQLYQDRHPPEGLHINVGPGGLSIEGK
jgi:RsiW-degrading membrane proteinase PrsW (M82 family)